MAGPDVDVSPGRNMELTFGDIKKEIEKAGIPLTVKMIADRTGKSRRTVYNRIQERERDDEKEFALKRIEYGNATAYDTNESEQDGYLVSNTSWKTNLVSVLGGLVVSWSAILPAVLGFASWFFLGPLLGLLAWFLVAWRFLQPDSLRDTRFLGFQLLGAYVILLGLVVWSELLVWLGYPYNNVIYNFDPSTNWSLLVLLVSSGVLLGFIIRDYLTVRSPRIYHGRHQNQ